MGEQKACGGGMKSVAFFDVPVDEAYGEKKEYTSFRL